MLEHIDTLNKLAQKSSLREKLIATHGSIKETFPFIIRIAIALYDPQTNVLKTYVHSSGEDNPLDHYQSPSLRMRPL